MEKPTNCTGQGIDTKYEHEYCWEILTLLHAIHGFYNYVSMISILKVIKSNDILYGFAKKLKPCRKKSYNIKKKSM